MSAVPTVSTVSWGGPADPAPLLVLGPSLGTSARTLWGTVAEALTDRFEVVGWDLPGHGVSEPAKDAFSIAELAEGVLAAVDLLRPGAPFHYAGDSVGGCVGLQLLLDHPDRVSGATLLCTGAKIGTAEGWQERAATVRAQGTGVMVEGSIERWFAPGFVDRAPEVAEPLLQVLRDADASGYAAVCDALAAFDVRHRLGEIAAPVVAVAGEQDQPTPVACLREIAEGVRNGHLVTLPGVAHLAPAEAPAQIVRLLA